MICGAPSGRGAGRETTLLIIVFSSSSCLVVGCRFVGAAPSVDRDNRCSTPQTSGMNRVGRRMRYSRSRSTASPGLGHSAFVTGRDVLREQVVRSRGDLSGGPRKVEHVVPESGSRRSRPAARWGSGGRAIAPAGGAGGRHLIQFASRSSSSIPPRGMSLRGRARPPRRGVSADRGGAFGALSSIRPRGISPSVPPPGAGWVEGEGTPGSSSSIRPRGISPSLSGAGALSVEVRAARCIRL